MLKHFITFNNMGMLKNYIIKSILRNNTKMQQLLILMLQPTTMLLEYA